MKKIIKIYLVIIAGLISVSAQAKLNVVTTTTDIASVAKEVGGDSVEVVSIAKGTQDPHFIEAKPSFMVKVNKADLLISVGLGLEVGWLPSIVQGARNPKVLKPEGKLEVGPLLDPIEVPAAGISRADGDVHPEGNPHIWLDPIRAGTMALKIADKLAILDELHRKDYEERAKKLNDRMIMKTKGWKARIEKSGIKKIITYHKTLNYFFARFGIEVPIELEPKPGIPPTSNHIISVLKTVKEQKIPLVLIENYYDHTVADRIKQDDPKLRVMPVPVSVDGEPNVNSLDALYERLVQVIEGT